jgi:hypothetical protein
MRRAPAARSHGGARSFTRARQIGQVQLSQQV